MHGLTEYKEECTSTNQNSTDIPPPDISPVIKH